MTFSTCADKSGKTADKVQKTADKFQNIADKSPETADKPHTDPKIQLLKQKNANHHSSQQQNLSKYKNISPKFAKISTEKTN